MKLMDEVKLESSVEALEKLLAIYDDSPWWPQIKQNLHALREVLRDGTDGVRADPPIPTNPTPIEQVPFERTRPFPSSRVIHESTPAGDDAYGVRGDGNG